MLPILNKLSDVYRRMIRETIAAGDLGAIALITLPTERDTGNDPDDALLKNKILIDTVSIAVMYRMIGPEGGDEIETFCWMMRHGMVSVAASDLALERGADDDDPFDQCDDTQHRVVRVARAHLASNGVPMYFGRQP